MPWLYRFDWRFEMQEDVFGQLTVFPCIHKISEVGKRFKPFSTGEVTVSPPRHLAL